MLQEITVQRKRLSAKLAHECPGAGMSRMVYSESALLPKRFITDIAFVRLLSCVNPHVFR